MRFIYILSFSIIYTLAWSQQTEIIALPFGNEWQYNDKGAELTLQYNLPFFEDTPLYNENDWTTDKAPFGYGHPIATALISNTDSTSAAITTYFLAKDPHFLHFPEQIDKLYLTVRYDDAFAFYFNGFQVARENLFPISYSGSTASNDIAYTEVKIDITAYKHLLSPINYLDNFLAAELHLSSQRTDSAYFDAQLSYTVGARLPLPINYVTAGPYLSPSTQTEAIITYYTSQPSNTIITYGIDANNLNNEYRNDSLTTRHEARIGQLSPGKTYHYAINGIPTFLNRTNLQFVKTAPSIGKDTITNIWVTGDFGNGLPTQHLVYADYLLKNGLQSTDLWMWLGDNAYDQGTFGEYQRNVFDIYDLSLRNHVLLPTLGNHDAKSCITTQDVGPYFDLFTLPKNGETNTVASGTEAYYSYNYANIHFICLESTDNNRMRSGKMMQWLEQDLKSNTAKWTIAFWHHPPYSKGSHDSDNEGQLIEMRENANPLLEKYGVDLVLNGHSHSYERTYLLDAHYGKSETFDAAIHLPQTGDGSNTPYEKTITKVGHKGTVYALVGSSGISDFDSSLDHPAHASTSSLIGSMLLQIDGNELHAEFISPLIPNGMGDKFTIVKTNEIEPCTTSLILPDSLKICGDSTIIHAGDDYWNYEWNTGSTDSSITATQNGYYTVKVQRFQDCYNTDSVYVHFVRPEFSYSIDNPCLGDSVTIAVTNTDELIWNDSIAAQTFTIYNNEAIAYRGKINDCNVDDTLYVPFTEFPEVNVSLTNTDATTADAFEYQLINRNSYDSIRWDFGDGTSDTSQYGQHYYSNPAAYNASLILYKNACVITKNIDINRVVTGIHETDKIVAHAFYKGNSVWIKGINTETILNIVNTLGQSLTKTPLQGESIFLPNLPTGRYWIKYVQFGKSESLGFNVP